MGCRSRQLPVSVNMWSSRRAWHKHLEDPGPWHHTRGDNDPLESHWLCRRIGWLDAWSTSLITAMRVLQALGYVKHGDVPQES
jgi:hypothetical protein